MRTTRTIIGAGILLACAGIAYTQIPPTAVADQASLLKHPDPKLAANKKLVYDMYRVIVQGGHTEMATQYFTEGYIQHNPNVPSGRDALVTYIKATRPARPLQPTLAFPMVCVMADGDMVLIATVSYSPDPTKPGTKYAGTHFDLYRIESGKIAEHWDSVAKDPERALHFDPNTQNKP